MGAGQIVRVGELVKKWKARGLESHDSCLKEARGAFSLVFRRVSANLPNLTIAPVKECRPGSGACHENSDCRKAIHSAKVGTHTLLERHLMLTGLSRSGKPVSRGVVRVGEP